MWLIWLCLLTQASSEEPGSHLSKAEELLRLGDLEGAFLEYRRAVEVQPNLAEAYCGLGRVYYKMGDYIRAGEMYRKALRID